MNFQKILENEQLTKMDVFWEIGRNFKKIWVRGQKRSLKYFSNVGMSLARMRPENINLIFFFNIYNWHSLWKLPSSNLASSLQSRLIISLPLSNDENFTLNLARHLLTYILSSGLEQEQCSGIKSFLTSNFYFLFYSSIHFTWCFILS